MLIFNHEEGGNIFHSNIQNLYPKGWVDKCINSTILQRERDFKIYEINYGGDDYSVFDEISYEQERDFYSKKLSNRSEAMNFIIDRVFFDGCDFVFNTNLDDFYTPN